MKLIQVTERIWTAPSPLTVLGIIQLNTRMTIIRLQSGKLWIHSPIPWTEELDSEIRTLGEIEYIVAPSCFHHMFVGPWKEHHPKASICAPNGLRRKRSDLQIDHDLQIDGHKLWQDDINCVEIKGMPFVQEHVFFHRKSRTLIVTDLLFFLPLSTGFTSFYAWLNGVKETVSTPLLFKSAIKDKTAFSSSIEEVRLMAGDVQNLSLCHHIVLTTDAPTMASRQLQQENVAELLASALAKF